MMNHAPYDSSSSITEKLSFLSKYDNVPKVIKANASCYAISHEWFANLECLINLANMEPDIELGNPGPINNLPLLDLSTLYQELVNTKNDTNNPGSVDPQLLSDLTDWDNMSLKPALKYRQDFVIISAFLWKFLQERFKGGPEIKLLTEPKPENSTNIPSNAVTQEDEGYMDPSVIVNLNLSKIHVTKDQDFAASTARYVSLSTPVQGLLGSLCEEYFFPPHRAVLLHRSSHAGMVELENKKKSLTESGVQEGSFLSVSRTSDSILGNQTSSQNAEIYDREDADSNKGNDGDDRNARNLDGRDLDFEEYIGMNSYHGRGEDVEMKDFKGDYNNTSPDKSNNVEDKDQIHPNLDVFLKRSRETIEKQRIKLSFKPLPEIKASLASIQQEWKASSNNGSAKKD